MTTTLAVDADPLLTSSFRLNFPETKLLLQDIRTLDASILRNLVPSGVDGVMGGPPCQAFSEMGRRDMRDPRRELILEYFRIVRLLRPKFFLFENVLGLAFEQNVSLLDDGLGALPAPWKIIGPNVVNAADFGAPTRRRRLFVFGFDSDQMEVPKAGQLLRKSDTSACVRDAISDLKSARFLGASEADFDVWRYDGRTVPSAYAKQMRSRKGEFTSHRKTVHNQTTLDRFADLAPGDRDSIGRYMRLTWEGLCPTLRAGTGKDRGSYQAVRPIHPTENRVITARESARLQGFPDDFLFHPTVWHSCRMIGNSVSPIVAKTFLSRIGKHLRSAAGAA